MAQLDTRVYYNYYDKQNNSTAVSYRQGSQGTNCATPPVNSATCFTIAALTEEAGELFSYTKNAAGFDASWAFNRTNKLLGGFDWESIKRHADGHGGAEVRRLPLLDRVPQHRLEQPERPAEVRVPAAAVRPRQHGCADVVSMPTTRAYDVNNFDANVVKLNVDWTPAPLWLVGLGATWRDIDYKDNFYGRTKDKNQQYDATVSWGDEQAADHRHRQLGQDREQPGLPDRRTIRRRRRTAPRNFTWGTQNTQDGWMAAALVDWAATDKLMLTASYSYQKTNGGVDFSSGNTQAGGGFNGGPLVNYVTDNTKLQRFQLKGSYNINNAVGRERRVRVREVRLQRRPDGGLRQLLPVLPEPEHGGRRIELLVVTRARSPTRATRPTWSG